MDYFVRPCCLLGLLLLLRCLLGLLLLLRRRNWMLSLLVLYSLGLGSSPVSSEKLDDESSDAM